MNRYSIHAGSYLVTKEFRYITMLRITPLLTKHYKERKIDLFYHCSIEHKSNHIHFFTNQHDSVFLINSRSVQFSLSKKRLYLIALASLEITLKFCRVPVLLLILMLQFNKTYSPYLDLLRFYSTFLENFKIIKCNQIH